MRNLNSYAFYQTILVDATIPSAVTSIGSRVFGNCTKLKTITCLPINPPSLDSLGFQNATALVNIYVPASAVDTYKAASNWSAYASKISAIPE